MTATDILRELLDERGVEWIKNDSGWCKQTDWTYDGELTAEFNEWEDGTARFDCDTWCFTPERAIEITLGRGTCHCTTPDDAWCFACSACGKSFPRSELSIAHNHGEINYCPNCGAKVVDNE